jgi:hypothetical protein
MSRIARTTTNTLFEGIQIINKTMSYLCRKYEDSRQYCERRLDAALCEQDVKQGFKDRRRKEDQRPYCERRLDPVLCEQDVKQGFKERRNRPYVNFMMMFPAVCIAPALPDVEEKIEVWDIENQIDVVKTATVESESESEEEMEYDMRWEEEAGRRRRRQHLQIQIAKEQEAREKWMARLPPPPPLVIVSTSPSPPAKKMEMNQVMVIKMNHLFRCEITDEIYQNNVQSIRDQMNIHYEENVAKIDYGKVVAAPVKRNWRVLDIV